MALKKGFWISSLAVLASVGLIGVMWIVLDDEGREKRSKRISSLHNAIPSPTLIPSMTPLRKRSPTPTVTETPIPTYTPVPKAPRIQSANRGSDTDRQIFNELAWAEDRATEEAMRTIPDSQIQKQIQYERELRDKYTNQVKRRYGLSDADISRINSRAGREGWMAPMRR